MADYIDRQMTMDKINERQRKLIYCFGLENDMVKIMDIARSIVIAMPSADVQPVRHGKWIKAQRKGITSYGDGFAECNKCHEVSWLGWNDKYCRNCGARMDGE